MRPVNLLFAAAVLVLIGGLAAQAQIKDAAADNSSATPAISEFRALTPHPSFRINPERIVVIPGDVVSGMGNASSVCLKLRTYVVRRVTPGSDETRLHSYSTCQPSWKFETRSAIQNEAKPDQRITY